MNREIDNGYCSCGGRVESAETTDEEEEKYGCGRRGCCVMTYQCKGCETRFIFELNAPEMTYE